MQGSAMSAIERIARVIAGQRLSINADGSDPSAANAVDMEWQEHLDDARAILRTLREPDSTMAQAGDVEIWGKMVEAALAASEAGNPPRA